MTRPHKPTPPAEPGVYDRHATGTREYWIRGSIGSGLTMAAMLSRVALEQHRQHVLPSDNQPFGYYPDVA